MREEDDKELQDAVLAMRDLLHCTEVRSTNRMKADKTALEVILERFEIAETRWQFWRDTAGDIENERKASSDDYQRERTARQLNEKLLSQTVTREREAAWQRDEFQEAATKALALADEFRNRAETAEDRVKALSNALETIAENLRGHPEAAIDIALNALRPPEETTPLVRFPSGSFRYEPRCADCGEPFTDGICQTIECGYAGCGVPTAVPIRGETQACSDDPRLTDPEALLSAVAELAAKREP